MTTSKKNAGTQQQTEQKVRGLVSCLTCAYGPLHRYDNNPVLAECHKQPLVGNERFQYQIEVACCLRKCIMYKRSTEVKPIEQRYHERGVV